MPKAQIVLVNEHQAILRMPPGSSIERAKYMSKKLNEHMEKGESFAVSDDFEVVDMRQTELEQRVTAIERWIDREDEYRMEMNERE